jgi:hypothetical protein
MLVIIISFRFMIQHEAIRLKDSFFINDNFYSFKKGNYGMGSTLKILIVNCLTPTFIVNTTQTEKGERL